jgi:aldose 1-epimerase
MYVLEVSPFGQHQRFDFLHAGTGNGFSIVPGSGANVLNIRFGGENIVDGYDTPEDLEACKWGKSTILFPFPNRLKDGEYHWNNKKYSFPLNNASTGNAIHGFARDHAFEVEKVELTPESAAIYCLLKNARHATGYPFAFELRLRFSIQNTPAAFSLDVSCKNMDTQDIPVGFGWHPYFKLAPKADEHYLKMPAATRIDIDDRMIPNGKRLAYSEFNTKKRVNDTFLDTCFEASKPGTYSIDLWGKKRRISVQASGRQCPFFQIFTPPHRESIALEPMTCNVDAFNNNEGLITLAPGKTWKAGMKIVCR